MAKKSTNRRPLKGTTPKVPRGIRPPRTGFRVDSAIMKNGGCKKK